MERGTILLTDEDKDGYGYLRTEYTSIILVTYWAKETETKSVTYLSLHDLWEKSRLFILSELVDWTPLHQSKYRMCQAFIDDYESKIQSPHVVGV